MLCSACMSKELFQTITKYIGKMLFYDGSKDLLYLKWLQSKINETIQVHTFAK